MARHSSMKFVSGLIKKPLPSSTHRFGVGSASTTKVPPWMDESSLFLESSNQGTTSKCVAYATAGLIEYHNWKKGFYAQIDPDPIYAEAKRIDGIEGEGTTLEAGLQAAVNLKLMPADTLENMSSVSTLGEVLRAFHQGGPLLLGMRVFSNWQYADASGLIAGGGTFLGYHCVLFCAYDMTDKYPWVGWQNSWGMQQGFRGFNRMLVPQFEQDLDYGLLCLPRSFV